MFKVSVWSRDRGAQGIATRETVRWFDEEPSALAWPRQWIDDTPDQEIMGVWYHWRPAGPGRGGSSARLARDAERVSVAAPGCPCACHDAANPRRHGEAVSPRCNCVRCDGRAPAPERRVDVLCGCGWGRLSWPECLVPERCPACGRPLGGYYGG